MKILILTYTFLATLLSMANNVEELTINSQILGEERKILVHLPKEYQNNPSQKFEVVYVFDAQNRAYFDMVHSTLAIQDYGLAPMIVVGIISNKRNVDFLPGSDRIETKQQMMMTGFGNAKNFKTFLKQEVFKKMDEKYRTLPTKIGIGHSNGATLLNYAFINEPTFFDAYFSIDANFSFDQQQLLEKLKSISLNSIDQKIFYYACAANNNKSWLSAATNFTNLLQERSNGNINIETEFLKEESHSTVFQQGVINAFKSYLQNQFFNADNLISYYKLLEEKQIYNLSSSEIEEKAKIYLNNGFKKQAQTFISAFENQLNKEDTKKSMDLIGLFETGNLYLQLDNFKTAKYYFDTVENKLEQFKPQMTEEQYEYGKKMLKEKQAELKKKM